MRSRFGPLPLRRGTVESSGLLTRVCRVRGETGVPPKRWQRYGFSEEDTAPTLTPPSPGGEAEDRHDTVSPTPLSRMVLKYPVSPQIENGRKLWLFQAVYFRWNRKKL